MVPEESCWVKNLKEALQKLLEIFPCLLSWQLPHVAAGMGGNPVSPVFTPCCLMTREKQIMTINQVLSSNTKSQPGPRLHCAKLFKKTQ